jgi:benzoate-CoA ligase
MCNAARQDKTALIDDVGSMTYGKLTEQIRRFAGGLQAMGLKREERVLLLMQDSSDWVVAFLGALYAGVVPVAVNTLLTAEDYAFMLSNSRAQAALVSGALLPTLQEAMDLVKTEVPHRRFGTGPIQHGRLCGAKHTGAARANPGR